MESGSVVVGVTADPFPLNRDRSRNVLHNGQSDHSVSSRTKSIRGTLEYMAPEILIMFGKRSIHEDGYTGAVDFWSLGILIYKLLVGDEPYNKMSHTTVQALLPSHLAHHSNYYEAFTALFGTLNEDVCDGILTPDTRDLLRGLLSFDPEGRLGYNATNMKAGHDALMSHPFFGSIDWALLEAKRFPPPYIPSEETLDIMSGDRDRPPRTLCELLREANKGHWCEEIHSHPNAAVPVPIPVAVPVPPTVPVAFAVPVNVDAPSVRSPGSSSHYRMHVLAEDQYYFRMWHYVSPELLRVTAE